jgi:transketolase
VALNELRKQIVLMAHRAGSGHIPSALSILHIVWVLYDNILTPDDKFILSKGHGCLALYVVLAKKGFISTKHLESFGEYGSILGGHPDRNKIPGVGCSTGSLGHGLPQAVGMALAKKIKGESGRVYCLVGDGECNEGSIWEAAMLASHHKLDNLTVIVDYNHSTDRAVDLGDISEKFRAFGFSTYSNITTKVVPNEPSTLLLALCHGLRGIMIEGPVAVIINTVKGDGCKRMADPAWHHRAPNDVELAEILQELS